MDVTLLDLWLPIIASAVAVFFASFLAHMVLKHHKEDFQKLPDEDAVMNLVRDKAIPAGRYMFPYFADFKEMESPENKARYEAGPHGVFSVFAATPNFGRNLVLTFLLFLGISIFSGYLAAIGLMAGANGTDVFRLTATAAIGAHCIGFLGDAIWFNTPRRAVINDLLDGIAYGLITGLVFTMLWPGVPGI